MTIEDWISRARIEERNYPAMSEDYHNLAQWLEELQGLRTNYRKQKEINLELVEENEDLKTENAELKRLLKLAVEDLQNVRFDECFVCKFSGGDCLECDGTNDNWEWKHSDEVKGLIEDGNELDTGV